MANELTYQSVFTGQEMDERFTAVAQLQAALLEVETALSAKYVKPASGIPETDLAANVQSALALARTAVQSLSDYYTKAQVDDITAAIAASVDSTSGVVVATLPSAGAGTLGKIYYVGPDANGFYDRYVTSYDGSTYTWLALGNTEVDMTQYATVEQLNLLDQKVDSEKDFEHAGSGTVFTPYNIISGHTYHITVAVANTMVQVQNGNSTSTSPTLIGTISAGSSMDWTADGNYDYIRTYKSSGTTAELTIRDTNDILAQIDSKVPKSDVDSIINEELILTSAQDWDWESGYWTNTGGKQATGAGAYYKHCEDYVPVVPGLALEAVGNVLNVPIVFYDINKEFIGASDYGTQTGLAFTVPDNAYFLRMSYVAEDSVKLYLTNGTYKTLMDVAHLSGSGQEFDLTPVGGALFTRKNEVNADFQNYTHLLFPEGFVASKDDVLSIGGNRSISARGVSDNAQTTLSVKLNKGNAVKTSDVNVIGVSPASLQGNDAFVLCIGESTTAAIVRNPYKGAVDASYCWPSAMQHFADLDNIDLENIKLKTLGTKHWNYEATSGKYTYKGTEYTPRSFNEGIGGWAAYAFLNLPCGARFGSSALLDASKLWYFLGLATKTAYNAASYNTPVVDYDGSASQISQIVSTPFGKYKVDVTAALWNWAKAYATAGNEYGYPTFTGTGDFSGTSAQITLFNEWAEDLAASPINPFYSLTEARTGASGTGFSLSAYLSRYRTMDDAGERLTGAAGATVTGSDGKTYTIGTEVANTADWDVCTPNAVILNVGINDMTAPETATDFVNVIKTFVAQFSVPVAYFFTRVPGACDPSAWSDRAVVSKLDGATFAFAHSVIPTLAEWFAEQNDKYFLPAYHITPPASVLYNFVEDNVSDGGAPVLNGSYSNMHPSWDAYRAIGMMCLAWVTYVVSQKAEPITITHDGTGNRFTQYEVKNGHKYNFAVTGKNILIGVCNDTSSSGYVDWGVVSAGTNYTFTSAGDYSYIRTYSGAAGVATIVVTEV